MQDSNLYLVFTATQLKTGHVIRFCSGEKYSHVSVSLNADLFPVYSYARLYYSPAFYGGFTEESMYRYTRETPLKVCSLPIPAEAAEKIQEEFTWRLANPGAYNFASLLAYPFHMQAQHDDSFTCTEFAYHLLKSYAPGLDLKDPPLVKGQQRGAVSLQQMQALADPYLVYEGTVGDFLDRRDDQVEQERLEAWARDHYLTKIPFREKWQRWRKTGGMIWSEMTYLMQWMREGPQAR